MLYTSIILNFEGAKHYFYDHYLVDRSIIYTAILIFKIKNSKQL